MEKSFSLTAAGICEAARAGDTQAIDYILAKRPELLGVENPHNWTKTVEGHQVRGSFNRKPVEVASFFNQPAAVAKLLEVSRDSHGIGKPWDDHLPFDGHFNSLRIARSLEHVEVINAIVADLLKRIYIRPKLLNAADSDGRTALYYAADQGHLPLVCELLARGAEPDPKLKSGHRVIHAVLDSATLDEQEEYRRVARLLIEHGAEFDLWVAVELEDIERARELLASDPSLAKRHYLPNNARLSGGFPLVRACAKGNASIVELLLDHGADINADVGIENPPEFGMPLVATAYAKHYNVAHLLLDRGASVHAYPNCAAPLVDMLYYAAVEESPGWLALGELKSATDDWRSHLQPNDGGSDDAVAFYKRVVSLGGEPQMYSHVKMQNYSEIERLLREEPESIGRNPGGEETVFSCLSHAAAWLGNSKTMELCLTVQPGLHSPDAANYHISAAIRSHNRDGSFADYRNIIEMNLRYLKEHNAPITVHPLWMLADDFLENYSYGTHPDLPAMDDLLNLAELFLDYGADIDEREPKSGRTALAHAANEGHVAYVAFLLERNASTQKDDPPETNSVALARKHGFVEILDLLGESLELAETLNNSIEQSIEAPSVGAPPVFMSPLNNAIIQLGKSDIEATFQPKGKPADTHSQFVEFPEPFADDEFANVRLFITNRNHPQIIASATTCLQNGKQGFVLRAQHCVPAKHVPKGELGEITGVSFSWMAVLLTDRPQPKRFEVRYGLIPWLELPGHGYHEYSDTADLFADEPLPESTGEKYVFLTTTTSNVTNGAASLADDSGIKDLSAYQVSRHDGGGRMYYLVIAESTASQSQNSQGYFESDKLWLHATRVKPIEFFPNGIFSAWRVDWQPLLKPFRDRKPCVFVSANSHGVKGHHCHVVPMSRGTMQNEFRIIGLNLDPTRGQSNFDCLAIGHSDIPAEEIAAANRDGLRFVEPWERFLAIDGCDETSFELADSGQIGVNEFGAHGGSLLFHAIYERHERVNVALARRLFALGTDPNQSHPTTGLTPLHLAAYFNRVDMTNLLIERGANVGATTISDTISRFPTPHECSRITRSPIPPHVGETPLHYALLQRSYEVARLLLDAEADPNAEDTNGARPIDYLPDWEAYPDNALHWRLVNHRQRATKEDLLAVIRLVRHSLDSIE